MKKNNEPQYLPSPLNNNMLNYSVYYFSVKEKILYSILCLVAGGLVGLVFYGGLFKDSGEYTLATYLSNIIVAALFGVVALLIFLPFIKKTLMEKRAKKLRRQFADLLEVLSTLFSAGSTLNDAFLQAERDLQAQYSVNDYIIREVAEINEGIRNGISLEEMLYSFGRRSNNQDIINFSNVIANCYRLGGDFRVIIRRTRDIIVEKIEIEEEINTKMSSNSMQLNAMTLMPIILVGLLKTTNGTFAENLSSLVGVAVTSVALVLFVVAYFWGRKIIKVQ